MSSRIRTDAKHVFDCFLEIVAPQSEKDQPWILQSYPANYKDKEAERLRSVPQFTFPCPTNVTAVQHFSFVLTNLEAQWTFGFCRYAPNSETALCFLSCLPWHEVFFKLLNQCAELVTSTGPGDSLTTFLSAVHQARLPLPGLVFHVQWAESRVFTAATPSTFHLPSIPENRNLTEYFNAVDAHSMLVIFASMLYERRILVTSKKLSRLSACVQAANSLIYPMFWQHIFIPVLPAQLMDYLSAPMPFLIGVPDPLMKRIRRAELGEVVILDADNNKVETPFDDLDSIPTEVLSNLRRSLKPGTGLLGDSVARAFLQALVHLIGGYRDALKYRQGEKITFSEDAFVMSRSASLQPFLEQMLQLQLFRQFIEERLDLLNTGKGFSDEFELECVVFTEKHNKKFKNQYSALTHNVKKESMAMAKAVKDKANPAMKAMKDGGKAAKDSLKDGGKIAKKAAKASYKDVRSKFKEGKGEEMREDNSSTQSAPSSPTLGRTGSMTLPTPHTTPLMRNNTDMNFGVPGGRVLKYERFDPDPSESNNDASPDFEEMPRLEYNLMSDLDEVMMRNKSGSLSSHMEKLQRPLPPPAVVQEVKKKPSQQVVADLISLDTGDDQSIIFDPLASDYSNNGHKKLSRTGTEQSRKYENYQPAGGSGSQPQFRQFVATMTSTDSSRPSQPRSSADTLLADYGLNFGQANLSSSTGSQQHLNFSQANLTSSTQQQKPMVTANYRPAYQTSYMPPPPLVPPRTSNSSFLHSTLPLGSAVSSAPTMYSQSNGSRPVPPPPSNVRNATNCRTDSLADLDPLRKTSVVDSSKLQTLEPLRSGASDSSMMNNSIAPRNVVHGLAPPSVPPRSKKQWTTFD